MDYTAQLDQIISQQAQLIELSTQLEGMFYILIVGLIFSAITFMLYRFIRMFY